MATQTLREAVETALVAVESVVPDAWTEEQFDDVDKLLSDALKRLTTARNAIIRGYPPKAFPSRVEREELARQHLR